MVRMIEFEDSERFELCSGESISELEVYVLTVEHMINRFASKIGKSLDDEVSLILRSLRYSLFSRFQSASNPPFMTRISGCDLEIGTVLY